MVERTRVPGSAGRARNCSRTVKTGCRTCKIRKVKCDEGRPECFRCTSTSRVCDGYGIWGGGGTVLVQRQSPVSLKASRAIDVVPRPPVSIFLPSTSTNEKASFDWFRRRTATKLPGSFSSHFWQTLLLQASVEEGAVLHAVLALSCTHRTGVSAIENGKDEGFRQEGKGVTALQHYAHAIKYLQPHFASKEKSSFRVALIACIVFVCFDLLRGHFNAAQVHLHAGLEILYEMQMLCGNEDGVLYTSASRDPADDCIVEVFSRLNFQLEMIKYGYPHKCLIIRTPRSARSEMVFRFIKEAWQELQDLLCQIMHLGHDCRELLSKKDSSISCHSISHRQLQIQSSLSSWLYAYNHLKETQPGPPNSNRARAYLNLNPYHTIAIIMVATCTEPANEMIFDAYTPQFSLVISQLTRLPTANSDYPVLPGHTMDMSRSIVDLGWIPPLYFTALKCRVHSVRMKAVEMLESVAHREGIWDSKGTARVARKVVEVEEAGLSDQLRGLDTCVVPASARLSAVEVELLGAPVDTIRLCGRTEMDEGGCRVLVSEFDVERQQWWP